MRSGNPIRFASARRAESSTAEEFEPGVTGTPAASIRARARSLPPISSIASGDGPTQVSPASATARANSALSDRKP